MRKPSKSDVSEPDDKRSRKSSLDEDLGFQRKQWRVERVSWVVMVIIIASALAGLLGGSGPLARASTTGTDGTGEVKYARFARHSAPTTLDVNVAPSGERNIRLRVSDEYLSAMNVRAITPPPTSTSVADRQHILVFDRLGSPSVVMIRLELEPIALGLQRGWVAVDSGAPMSFSHFIYP